MHAQMSHFSKADQSAQKYKRTFEPCNARLLLCSGANLLPQAPFGRYTHTCTCVLRPGALSISSAAPIWAARSRIERKPR
jgi:hypothetical protein